MKSMKKTIISDTLRKYHSTLTKNSKNLTKYGKIFRTKKTLYQAELPRHKGNCIQFNIQFHVKMIKKYISQIPDSYANILIYCTITGLIDKESCKSTSL